MGTRVLSCLVSLIMLIILDLDPRVLMQMSGARILNGEIIVKGNVS
jgi:hypothetical protein